jgi:UDP-N-acetylglucosamine acyltransferase
VPPFAKVYGTPPRLTGVNAVGIERAGCGPELAAALLAHYETGEFLAGNDWLPDDLAALSDHIAWWRAQPDLRPVTAALD